MKSLFHLLFLVSQLFHLQLAKSNTSKHHAESQQQTTDSIHIQDNGEPIGDRLSGHVDVCQRSSLFDRDRQCLSAVGNDSRLQAQAEAET